MNDGFIDRRQALVGLLALGASGAQAQGELADLARMRASGVLKVAVYKDNAPFSSGPAHAMDGLDVDLAGALARQLQLRLQLMPFDAGENMGDDLRNMVWRGHYLGYGPADLMLHVPVDKHLIQQTRQALIFAPYMRQVPVLLHDTRALPEVATPQDLQGHRLAAERGTGTASVLMGQGGGLLREQVTLCRSGVEAAQSVLRGEADAAYVLRSQAEAVLAGVAGARCRITALPLGRMPVQGWPIGLAIRAADKDLGQGLEQALRELRASGEMLALFQKRGMTLTAP
ncbi:MAG TPA: transporter substrate-binding domain-containing protein [Ramlibacter sp.]|nr:transporter substrate-binding domain-containing protein [Ramlibacter sp.]